MIIFVAILIVLACTFADALDQADMIEVRHIYPDHKKRAFIAFLYCVIGAFAVLLLNGWAKALAALPVMFAVRWIAFDILLIALRNVHREPPYKLSLTYISNKKHNNSVIDTLLSKLPDAGRTQYIVKFLFLALTSLIYIKT